MTISENKKNAVLGRAALFAMSFIWGSSFVMLKSAIEVIPTLYVLAFRFSGAAVLMLLLSLKDIKKYNLEYLKHGAIMGVFLFVAYTVQTYGLYYTTPGKNAFLTTTYCVIVPFLYWVITKERPDKYNIIAAVVCLIGVGFVSLRSDTGINIGDVLTVFCGLFFAMHIIATGRYAGGKSVGLLTMTQFAVAGLLSWAFALPTAPMPSNVGSGVIWTIVYLCVMCTAVCYVLQTYGQKYTPPSTVAVIMTLEAVFGTIISVIFYGEVLTVQLVFGFALIFAAVIMSETKFDMFKKKASNTTIDKSGTQASD
jgi:drug/metabolite transporter (DMT)-like permease